MGKKKFIQFKRSVIRVAIKYESFKNVQMVEKLMETKRI